MILKRKPMVFSEPAKGTRAVDPDSMQEESSRVMQEGFTWGRILSRRRN